MATFDYMFTVEEVSEFIDSLFGFTKCPLCNRLSEIKWVVLLPCGSRLSDPMCKACSGKKVKHYYGNKFN